jgi:hypothetical protein
MTPPAQPFLGRRAIHDPRDLRHEHRMRTYLATVPAPPRPTPWGFAWPPLDQGRTGTCVGHAGKELLLAEPLPQGTPTSQPTAFDLYDLACTLDEFTDNDNDATAGRQSGTSGNGLMKALRALAYITAYKNADPNDPGPELNDWLALVGPVCVGIDWPENWFNTDDHGTLPPPSANIAGGHEILIRWHDAANDRYLIQQSWGTAVGAYVPTIGQRDGLMYAKTAYILDLIKHDGDAKAPTEVLVAQPAAPPPA